MKSSIKIKARKDSTFALKITSFFCCFFLLTVVGCLANQEQNTNGLTAAECIESGGEWVYVQDCPSPCGPPPPTAENCQTIAESACITVCSEEANCNCLADRPFWLDGCVGVEECPIVSANSN